MVSNTNWLLHASEGRKTENDDACLKLKKYTLKKGKQLIARMKHSTRFENR